MLFIFKAFKWFFGIISMPLTILLLLYLGIKNEYWMIVDSDGIVVVTKTMGISLIVVWAVVGALFLLFEYLCKRTVKNNLDSQ